jgi:hypothetical protein
MSKIKCDKIFVDTTYIRRSGKSFVLYQCGCQISRQEKVVALSSRMRSIGIKVLLLAPNSRLAFFLDC